MGHDDGNLRARAGVELRLKRERTSLGNGNTTAARQYGGFQSVITYIRSVFVCAAEAFCLDVDRL